MDFRLDRSLNIPLGIQLRGLIEYAITFGALRPGEKLPSVREMAERAGVAPMTVAQVYRELKEAELIYSKPGSGSFIADASEALKHSGQRVTELHYMADALIDHARVMGMSAGDLTTLIHTRANIHQRQTRRPHLLMVGNFLASARDYAALIASALDEQVAVEATTVTQLRDSEAARAGASDADIILTFAHRRREVTALLPGALVVAVGFIPSEATRRALASLDPLARVVVVSIFAEFTALMKAGVERFAPHIQSVTVINQDSQQLTSLLQQADVLIYATGGETLAEQIAPGKISFEYRHVPDSGDIQRVVQPLLQNVAVQNYSSNTKGSYENQ